MVKAAPIDAAWRPYVAATFHLDCTHPAVLAYAETHAGDAETPQAAAVALYYAVRDGFWYDPYALDLDRNHMKASWLLKNQRGYCVEKAALLAAAARSLGIPSRLGFGDVRNHLGTDKLEAVLGTNLLVFHGYTELWLDEHWVKATPAFNAGLCQKLGVSPLEFDGIHDAVFQAYSAEGQRFMTYENDRGTHADWPADAMEKALRMQYGHLFDQEPSLSLQPLAHLRNRPE